MNYLPYSDSVEVQPIDEAEDIKHVLDTMQRMLDKALKEVGAKQSDVHVKSHGCAKGRFQILGSLPDELAQGLFREAGTYDAVLRFSNGASRAKPDHNPDGRGLAIKVFGVPGPKLLADAKDAVTQDFVMINHPVFVAQSPKTYARLEDALLGGGAAILTGGEWNPLHWHWGELIRAGQIAFHRAANPVSNTYYSMAPIRYGRYVAKYRAQPVDNGPYALPPELTEVGRRPDALRDLLEETLRKQAVRFEFQVQLRTSEQDMPVEDPTIEWPEQESPYRTVATLDLHTQEIGDLKWKEACKKLAFTVWHAIPEHRPLGGINRLRKEAYQLSSRWRHEGGAPREPESLDAIG